MIAEPWNMGRTARRIYTSPGGGGKKVSQHTIWRCETGMSAQDGIVHI